jgi:uncharacterized protein (TIGR03118 family)
MNSNDTFICHASGCRLLTGQDATMRPPVEVFMNTRLRVLDRTAIALSLMALLALVLPSSATRSARAAEQGVFHQTNLVSDQSGVALIQDPNLMNAWGITMSPTSPFWVANNDTGTSTLYSGDVTTPLTKVGLIVTIPGGSPTGTVFNGTSDFVVHSGTLSAPARFLFATQTGAIVGWSGTTNAQIGGSADAVYTGLAIGSVGTANYLYAADFEHRRIDVYDTMFHLTALDGRFSDPNIPNSYSTFNIQNIGGKLYVTYAQQSHKEPDEETDRGSGFVDVFDTSGHLLQRLIEGNHLKAPWGLAHAPADFGPFGNALIVGNFGDGQLHAYDFQSGKYMGEFKDESGKPVVIDGLWGITFGNGASGGDKNALYFAAGPDDETHGLFGSLRVGQP